MGLKVMDGSPTAISKYIRENEESKELKKCKRCGVVHHGNINSLGTKECKMFLLGKAEARLRTEIKTLNRTILNIKVHLKGGCECGYCNWLMNQLKKEVEEAEKELQQ